MHEAIRASLLVLLAGVVSAEITCSPLWKVLFATNSLGGTETLTSPPNQVSSCLRACLADPRCVGADVTDDALTCFVHDNAAQFAVKNVQVNTGTTSTQYALVSRCGSQPEDSACCSPTYEIYPNTQSTGATKHPELPSLESCFNFCVNDVPCVGLDYNITEQTCWIHTDPSSFAVKRSVPGVVQYSVTGKCSDVIGTGCPEVWQILSGTGSLDATLVPGVRILQDCLTYCNADPACLATDFNQSDSPPTCWTHTNKLYRSKTYTGPTVVQSRLIMRCLP